MGKQVDLMQGTLEMLILKAVSLGKLHGYGVLLRIQQISGEQLVIQQGSLYPALYRLEHEGAIKSEWGESENGRRAKYYTLTATGRNQLSAETERWNQMAGIIRTILRLTSADLAESRSREQVEVPISLMVAGCQAAQTLRDRDGGRDSLSSRGACRRLGARGVGIPEGDAAGTAGIWVCGVAQRRDAQLAGASMVG